MRHHRDETSINGTTKGREWSPFNRVIARAATASGAGGASRVISILLQLCRAVGEAHGEGAAHRDLSPQLLEDYDFYEIELPLGSALESLDCTDQYQQCGGWALAN